MKEPFCIIVTKKTTGEEIVSAKRYATREEAQERCDVLNEAFTDYIHEVGKIENAGFHE